MNVTEKERILVVDDDEEICQLLAGYLRQQGFEVDTAGDGERLFEVLSQRMPDLVILDIMLPGESGLVLYRRLQERGDIPVIFLTALDSVTDRVVGLELGADDYMIKPFEPRELLARIRTVLRRRRFGRRQDGPGMSSGHDGEPECLSFAGWELNVRSRGLHDPEGALVELSDAQYRLLMIFLAHPFQIMSRDMLLNMLHGRDAAPFDRSVDIQVSRLRNRLGDSAAMRLIRTVRGGGYMFAVAVTPVWKHA
ncbi:MAG TPA: response regulator transcription factor [Candidatus Avidesulfovibrio excrementigallinarum]|nr:response regulator transcription factor [Candidatus Avidesulfovibrio excrementigallinarum]